MIIIISYIKEDIIMDKFLQLFIQGQNNWNIRTNYNDLSDFAVH